MITLALVCEHCGRDTTNQVTRHDVARALSGEWQCDLHPGLGRCTPEKPHKRCGWFVEAGR